MEHVESIVNLRDLRRCCTELQLQPHAVLDRPCRESGTRAGMWFHVLAVRSGSATRKVSCLVAFARPQNANAGCVGQTPLWKSEARVLGVTKTARNDTLRCTNRFSRERRVSSPLLCFGALWLREALSRSSMSTSIVCKVNAIMLRLDLEFKTRSLQRPSQRIFLRGPPYRAGHHAANTYILLYTINSLQHKSIHKI